MSKSSSRSVSKTSKSSGESGSISKNESKSSYEEEEEGDFEEEEQLPPPKSGEYYYQDYKYVRPTQADFETKQLKNSRLFDLTKTLDDDETVNAEDPHLDPSILVTGFGMRNVKSFQRLIHMSHEQRRKWELRKLFRDQQARLSAERAEELKEKAEAISARTDSTGISTSTTTSSSRGSSFDSVAQTEKVTGIAVYNQKHLNYLLGLERQVEQEEEGGTPQDFEQVRELQIEDEFKYSTSKSIREAQRYLRVHHIFECFQFIASHLLTSRTQEPIEFILNLLNKCLLYRSSLGDPPLLYQKKHIEQLFNLMDRLQCDVIDFEQYQTGMKSLGISYYNENPVLDNDDCVSKETFVEEAYEAELASFNELIKRHPEKTTKDVKITPKSFEIVSVPSLDPPFFIPPDLLKFGKPYPSFVDEQTEE